LNLFLTGDTFNTESWHWCWNVPPVYRADC